jgi:serine/threonine protein kinase
MTSPNPSEQAAKPLQETQEFFNNSPSADADATAAPTESVIQPPSASVPPPNKSSGPAPKIQISTLGDFKLVAKLGEGGMGTVYKARQMSTGRLVAFKVLSQQVALKPGFTERFQREVRILGRLNHPNIVRYLAAGESHGFVYLAMELVDGGSIGTWLTKLGSFPVGDSLYIARSCAMALEYAHQEHLVHRDVKPDNLLVTKAGIVKLTDLGLAKTTDDSDVSFTKTGTGIGTPLYAPPEQARDAKHVDARSDIYSLGGMLYHFLTGQPPFQSENLLQIILMKEKGEYKPASQVNPKLPPALDRILAKMLDRKPENRYQSVTMFLAEIDRLNWTSEAIGFLKG